MKKAQMHLFKAALLSFALFGADDIIAAEAGQSSASAAPSQPIFATVGADAITHAEYAAALTAAARAKFYHGKPPESEVALLQREVGEKMVARILLLREAKQRGLRPDAAEIEKTVQSYDTRYANSEQWKKNREQTLPGLVARLEQDNLLSQLENNVRGLVKPNEKDVKAYYLKYPEKFTQPEQLRVALILLKVDPSSPAQVWDKANEEAEALAKRVRGGADLAELARLHSGDPSAGQGGDMGYLHTGMLPEGAQDAISKLQPGEIAVVRVLQGIAVLRLTDRKPARLMEFDAVKLRAQELMLSEKKEAAWTGFIAELKQKTPYQMDQSSFLPMVEPSNAQGNVK
jgi:parvulin-like peptidyl-prolyl isomerase